MMENELIRHIREALEKAASDIGLTGSLDDVEIEVTRPRQREHGDYATGVALGVASRTGAVPREVAETLARHLPQTHMVERVEIAGPGFINFFLAHGWLHGVLGDIERLGGAYGRAQTPGETAGAGRPLQPAAERVQVEFVSANPTGPLHVGSGRNAVYGDTLARLLEAAGHRVEREYYVNDAGRQVDLFAASVEARYLERFGRGAEVPEEGYRGAYVAELAGAIAEEVGDSLVDAPEDERRARLREEALRRTLEGIAHTLGALDVRIDRWFHESELHRSGAIEAVVQELRRRGVAYAEEGAVWFAASRYGDEKDRVLIRASGDPSYFAADCAYLRDKFARGFDRLVYIWGADHHGAVKRLQGAAEALGYEVDQTEFILYQLVALYRDGEPVRMGKRSGELVTLDELVEEVGADATRYTLASRSPDSAIDFDIELVKRQTLDNPVYYVQYAHARIASLIRHAEQQGIQMRPFSKVQPEELVHQAERDLILRLADLPQQVQLAAEARAPYRLTRYVEEVASAFHRFYTECRVVTDDVELTQARLHLAAATRQVIANVLTLLGIAAPESMERLQQEGS